MQGWRVKQTGMENQDFLHSECVMYVKRAIHNLVKQKPCKHQHANSDNPRWILEVSKNRHVSLPHKQISRQQTSSIHWGFRHSQNSSEISSVHVWIFICRALNIYRFLCVSWISFQVILNAGHSSHQSIWKKTAEMYMHGPAFALQMWFLLRSAYEL